MDSAAVPTSSTENPSSDPLRRARPPTNPALLVRWVWQLIKDIVEEYRQDGVGDLAASITFWTILSVPAAVLALVSAVSSLGSVVGTSVADDLEGEAQQFIADTFADSQALSEAVGELFDNSNASVVTVAALVAFFSLSRGFAGLIRALDAAYDIEEGRPWWHVRLVAIAMGLGTTIVVASGATALALLPLLPGGRMAQFLTVPVVFVLLVVWAATMFHLGPYHRTPWRYDMPGAILTAIGWVLATQGFALYVRLAADGNQVQSTVGAVLLGLTLIHLLSIVLLVGAELNDVISRRAGVVQQPVGWRARARDIKDRVEEVIEEHRDEGSGTTTPD